MSRATATSRGQRVRRLWDQGGLRVSVVIGTEVVAVLEFFAIEAHDPDDALLASMAPRRSQLAGRGTHPRT